MSKSRPLPEVGRFLSLKVLLDHDGKRAELKRLVQYRDRLGVVHMAHPGLYTDGRSGRVAYYIVGTPYRTRHLPAAVVHDWDCSIAQLLPPGPERKAARLTGDLLFAEMLLTIDREEERAYAEKHGRPMSRKRLRARRIKRGTMARGVRLGSWLSRNKPAAHWSDDFTDKAVPLLPSVPPEPLPGA